MIHLTSRRFADRILLECRRNDEHIIKACVLHALADQFDYEKLGQWLEKEGPYQLKGLGDAIRRAAYNLTASPFGP